MELGGELCMRLPTGVDMLAQWSADEIARFADLSAVRVCL
jgi:hypothetical protein